MSFSTNNYLLQPPPLLPGQIDRKLPPTSQYRQPPPPIPTNFSQPPPTVQQHPYSVPPPNFALAPSVVVVGLLPSAASTQFAVPPPSYVQRTHFGAPPPIVGQQQWTDLPPVPGTESGQPLVAKYNDNLLMHQPPPHELADYNNYGRPQPQKQQSYPPNPDYSILHTPAPYSSGGASHHPNSSYRNPGGDGRDGTSSYSSYRSQSRGSNGDYQRDTRESSSSSYCSRPNSGHRDSRAESRDSWDTRDTRAGRSGYSRDADRAERSQSVRSRSDRNERSERNDSYRSSTGDRNSSSKCSGNSRDRRERSSSCAAGGDAKASRSGEREQLLVKWRSNYCEHFDDIKRKLAEMQPATGAAGDPKEARVRSSPSDVYYDRVNSTVVKSTAQLDVVCELFEADLVQRGRKIRATLPPFTLPARRRRHKVCRHKSEKCSSSDSSDEDFDVDEEDCSMEELTKKIQHPHRLHPDLWHNEPGEMNDGPLCRCSVKSKRSGIRHGIYPGETGFKLCDPSSNNANDLFHYRITISPPTNFLTKTPTIIKYDNHEFIFEGFSLFSHKPIGELPTCKVIRFNIEYTILYIEEKMPENFTIRELDLFYDYLFVEVLEMLDLNLKPGIDGENSCPSFHFLPRFVRDLPENGKEVLAMAEVLRYLLDNSGPLVPPSTLQNMLVISQHEWQNYVDDIKDMVVTNPSKKPCSVRVDQLDRNVVDLPECRDPNDPSVMHPVIVHFGIRPPQLSYAGNPDYQKAWREYVKFRHLVANMSKPSYEDKRRLELKENKLQEMRTQGRMKRNITVAISAKDFYRTGIMCDIVQHAMLIPVLTAHLRFHDALDVLETNISYRFQNRYILQLALTHPSYKENFGTNPDHARNSLTNCGIRQPEYGDRKIHYMNTRKRGINTLINIMSRFGKEDETDSNISHNERLEFLGDAVVEFLTSIHLFFMFPDLEEGGLATYRAAIVQNQHLAVLARKLHLEEFMLYAHGSDLCHELELRHAMANCFEALMGSLLLDGGIDVADQVFSYALFHDEPEMKTTWDNVPPHPLQEQEPLGDRQWIESYAMLRELTKFEDSIGMRFRHIRLLARAFTDRSIGYTHLTLGSNQRLEFLGDTVLQLICSEYLYRHFPEHHEGHLSLLRSSLVNNRTQAVVCDDLDMTQYAVYSNPKPELKTKDRADLLEAFLGAIYVDRGLEPCSVFCHVCLFPRLQVFIMNQEWNDPKSKLQQCCLTLRTMDGGEPDIPVYKVIECIGPTNTRIYTVAVYFRGKRLASATGHSIQQAEMNAAKAALENSRELFPQLDHQKRVIAQSIKRQKGKDYQQQHTGAGDKGIAASAPVPSGRFGSKVSRAPMSALDDESNLPKQYRMREDISSDELDSDDFDEDCKSSAGVSPKKQSRVKTFYSSTSDSEDSNEKPTRKSTHSLNDVKRENPSPEMNGGQNEATETFHKDIKMEHLSCSSVSSVDDMDKMDDFANKQPSN